MFFKQLGLNPYYEYGIGVRRPLNTDPTRIRNIVFFKCTRPTSLMEQVLLPDSAGGCCPKVCTAAWSCALGKDRRFSALPPPAGLIAFLAPLFSVSDTNRMRRWFSNGGGAASVLVGVAGGWRLRLIREPMSRPSPTLSCVSPPNKILRNRGYSSSQWIW